MIAGVADTHTALWYVMKNPRLSTRAREFMEEAAAIGHNIAISSISLAEIVYLIEKGRLPPSVYGELKAALADSDYLIEEVPLSAEIVDAMRQVSRAEVPDMPDRIIAATGIYFAAPIISRDGRIRAANLQTVW